MHIENVIFLILSKNAYTKFSAVPYIVGGGAHDAPAVKLSDLS